MMNARLPILVLVVLLGVTSCKGYREFRQARKELKVEKAERKQQPSEQHSDEITIAQQNHFPDSLFFAMQRTPCFGHCPTYTVHIYQSGYATYHGQANVERTGKFNTRVSQEITDSILQLSQNVGLMMMLDSYDNSLITDLPSTLYKLNIGGTKKDLLCRVECPQRLLDFTVQCEALLLNLDWEKADF